MSDKANVATNPLAHPGDHPALQQPTHVYTDDTTLPGRDSEELPGAVTDAEVAELEWQLPPGALKLGASDCESGPPRERMERTVVGFERHAQAMEQVRRAVTLPVMGDTYESTRALHRLLRKAQGIVHEWADIGDERLGEIVHAANGIHATIMNVSGFAAQAAEMLDRATAKPAEWAAAFESIVTQAGTVKAYQLLAMASGALLAGPFTETWDNAVEWCRAFWDRP